jgi:hypothetical protein
LCRRVLDEVLAGRRWRDHRRDLQGKGGQTGLQFRRLGMANGISRDYCERSRPRLAPRG